MTDAGVPGAPQDLGSSFATVGYRYADTGEREFLAAQRRIQEAAQQLQQRLSQQAPITIPIAGQQAAFDALSRQATRTINDLRQQIARAKPFDPLVQQMAQAAAEVERRLQDLSAKRDNLRTIIADTGTTAAQRRQLTDNQGRVRSNTGDDQKFDSTFENARGTTSIGRGDGSPNEVRAEIEAANVAAEKLRGVLADIRNLKDQGGGRSVGPAAQEYLEAAQAAEQYGRAATAASAAQQAAEARATQLRARLAGLTAVMDDETRSDEQRVKAMQSTFRAAQQLEQAEAKLATATEAATHADGEQTDALKRLEAAQQAFARAQPRASTAASARQTTTGAPGGATQPEQAAQLITTAYATLDQAVTRHIETTGSASSAESRHIETLEKLRTAIDQVRAAYGPLTAAQTDLAKAPAVALDAPAQRAEATARRAKATVDEAAAEAARVEAQAQRLANLPTQSFPAPPGGGSEPPTVNPFAGAGGPVPAYEPPPQAVAAVERLSAAQKALNSVLDDSLTHEQKLELLRATHAQRVDILRTSLDQLRLASEAENKTEVQTEALLKRTQAAEAALAREETALAQERARAAAAQARTTQQGIGGAVRGTLQGFGVGSVLGGLGVAGAAALASRQITQVLEESNELAKNAGRIGDAYEAATKRAGVSAGDLSARLREASRGTATDANLQQSAIEALALHVGENAQQIGDLLAIARQKGKDFGLDTSEAFRQLVEGAGRASPEILNNLGILVDGKRVYADYARSIGTTADRLTEQQKVQAVVNDLIRNNTDLIQKNADAQLDAADKAAIAAARRDEALTHLGERSLPVQTGAATFLSNFFEGFDPQAGQAEAEDIKRQLRSVSSSYEDYVDLVKKKQKELLGDQNGFFAFAANLLGFGEGSHDIRIAEQLDIGDKQAYTSGKQADAADAAAAATARLAKAQDAASLSADDLAKNQAALADSIIQAGDQIEQQQRQLNSRLADLDDEHAKRHQDILDQISQAEADGVAQRERIAVDGQQRIDDAIAAEGLRAVREAEDRATEDSRRERDRHDQDVQAEADYQQRRQELIDRHHDQEVKDEADYQRELSRAQRQGQLDQYRSTADFLEQLYGLTRGRRNKAQLEEGRKELQAAIAEAKELAQTDPAAAAQLLAERERQINEGIQRKRDEAQLRRDARRGGGLSSGDVDQEIADENAARTEANRLAIDAIKQGAKDRADDRQRQKDEQNADFHGQLDDLDRQEVQRRSELQHQHQQEDADRAADRAREDRRRADDYAKQLDDMRQATRDQLAEFDKGQRDKIAKLQQGLKDEDDQYVAARKKVLDDYDQFIADLKDKLQKQANELDLSPDDRRKAELAALYEALGNSLGLAFARGVQTAAGQNLPPAFAPGGTLGGTGSAYNPPGTQPKGEVPVTPGEARAAQSIISGGKVISNYGADRSSLRGPGAYHQGFDVGGKRGDPIHALFSGTARGPYTDPSGGNVLYIDGDGQWKGVTAYYAHMDGPPIVRSGRVTAGQTIGRVGNSGDAAGGPYHAHVELIQHGQDLNPADALSGYQPPTPPSPARGSTGSAYSGQSYRTQAYQGGGPGGFTIWDRPPVQGGYAPGGAPVAYSRTVTVDLRGAHFGGNVTEQLVRGWVMPVVEHALDEREDAYLREIDDAHTRGSYK